LNISIRHIQHFIAVAEELHFRRAAQLTNVTQPALSRSVQALESELGIQLLSRNNRNVKLTAAGKEFLVGCTGMVDFMETTINRTIRADQTEFGGVNVGYTYIAMCGKLRKLIADFEHANPTIRTELVSTTSANQLDQLLREELDCCFLSGPVDTPIATGIESVVFQTDPYVVIVNNNHPLANRGSISIEELGREKLLLSGQPDDSTFNQHVTRLLNTTGIAPQIEYVPQDHIGVLGIVALERGVCIATEGYGCVYAEALSTLKLTGTDAKLPTLFAWRKNMQSESSRKFRGFVLRALQKNQSKEHRDYSPAQTLEVS